jgi:protein-glutamine gamma-glutamyltransferase
VWLENKGWQRVDPTAWVAPERIQYGMDISQSLAAQGYLNDKNRLEAIENALKPNLFKRILTFFKQHWDNINYKWDVWIISYDNSRQHDFFKSLGFEDIDRFGLFALMVIVVPLFFFIVSVILKRQTLSTDPLLRIYQRFCHKMAKAGLQRLRWEGPLHFQVRAIKRFPDKSQQIKQITDLFIQLHYGPGTVTKGQLKELKRQVRRF